MGFSLAHSVCLDQVSNCVSDDLALHFAALLTKAANAKALCLVLAWPYIRPTPSTIASAALLDAGAQKCYETI